MCQKTLVSQTHLFSALLKSIIKSCPTLCNPTTAACRAPLSMGFSRQEYWSGCHALLQGIFLTLGSNPGLLHCRWILYHLSHQGTLYLLRRKLFFVYHMLLIFLFVFSMFSFCLNLFFSSIQLCYYVSSHLYQFLLPHDFALLCHSSKGLSTPR